MIDQTTIRHNAIDFAFRFLGKGKAVEDVIREAEKIASFIENGPAKPSMVIGEPARVAADVAAVSPMEPHRG
jgi:hypothetical protein